MLSGDDGIITQAGKAKEETDSKGVQEQVELMTSEYIMQKNTGGEESIKKYYQTQASKGKISSIKDNADDTYTITKDGYEIKIDENGKVIEIKEKETVAVTEVWYKINDTTLHLSNNDLGGYTKHNENLSYPEWAGTYREPSNITEVIFENEISPTETASWFSYCVNLTEIKNISNLNTSNVINMSRMFNQCKNLTKLDLSSFNTNNVTKMDGMFKNCSGLTSLDLNNFATNNLTSMYNMFSGCVSLRKVGLKKFNTEKVTRMGSSFYNCISLEEINLTNFNTKKVSSTNLRKIVYV